jgi:hypothetical protein
MAHRRYFTFAALVLAAFPLAAAGDEAEDAFNSLYGAEYKKTLASRDTGDDVRGQLRAPVVRCGGHGGGGVGHEDFSF